MTKVIIQIPCLNEEESLGTVLKTLPRELPGVDVVEWLIIDDGSTDATVKVAKEHGVDHIVTHRKNRGLAKAFYSGILGCLQQDADIIVNTDADNQYCSSSIPDLVKPIVDKRADLVVGARPIDEVVHFSSTKKVLQKFGSFVVGKISKTNVTDAPSGFRALSRDAAASLNVFTEYTYTLETLIQAGSNNFNVLSVPVRVTSSFRPSRLVSSIPSYIFKSVITMIRSLAVYSPFQFFMWPAMISLITGLALGFRFLYYYITTGGAGHVQSVILCSLLLIAAVIFFTVGFLADLIGANRKMIKNIELNMLSQKKTNENCS